MSAPPSWLWDAEPAREEPDDTYHAPSSPSNSWSSAETQSGMSMESPLQDGAEMRRPKRCKISREQLAVLIKSFEEEPLPNFDQRQTLAKVLGMTPRSVQIWFQNRRQRLKPMQPKAASTATPLCGLQSAAMAARGAQASNSARTAQQHLGMPSLAAAAGLCNRGGSNIDQLMMSHAMSQLPSSMQQSSQSSFMGHSLSSYGDVMEPFAATKALLSAGGAMGLSPEIRGRSQPTGCPPFNLGGSLMPSSGSSNSLSNLASACGAPADGGHDSACPSPNATTAKAEKADGLLLLLACADGGNDQSAEQ